MKKILSLGLAGAMTVATIAGTAATAQAGPWMGKPHHHHGFNGGAFIAGTVLGLAALGAYGAYAQPYPYPQPYVTYGGGNWNAHVQWCYQHYPNSYNPRTNTYIGWNGVAYYCDSPFM